VVLESQETLKATNTEYTVWTIEYPVYSYATRSNEKDTVEDRLQELLNERIEKGSMEWENGILAVVGNEMEFVASTYHSWRGNDNFMLELGPIMLTPLQAIGAAITLIQTIGLIMLHTFVKPYLKEQVRKKKLERQALLVYLPTNQHHGISTSQSYSRSQSSRSHRSHSSRTQNYTKRDFIPNNIDIPERERSSVSSSTGYPVPY